VDPAAVLARFLDAPRMAYILAILDAYGRAAGGLLANGLAFAALFATIPTALVVLGFAGLLANDPQVQQELADALVEAFPPLADLIEGALDAVVRGAAVTSIIGIIGLIWTVSQLYVALDVAFARIFAATPEREFVWRTARGFVGVGGLLLSVVVLVLLASFLAASRTVLPGELGLRGAIADLLTSWPVLILIAVAALAVCYRVVPPRPPSWFAVRVPAVVIGLVIVGLSQLFVFLAPRLVGVAALAGSLATAFIALAWLSFTFQALLYGAAWVRIRDERGRWRDAVPPAPVREPLGGGPSAGDDSALASPAATAEPGVGRE
jgi:YihY family inner membrane protein